MKFDLHQLLVAICFCVPVHARQTAYCAGTNYNPSLTAKYICGDERLGPATLPTSPRPVGTLVRPYDRFGGLRPGAYLAAWLNATTGWWNYPPDKGFALDSAGTPVVARVTLPRGTLVDRFGGEGGGFLCPAATPYPQRSLPPSSLNGPALYPYNYHVYRVVEALSVMAGPVAPWFGQPGTGMQFLLHSSVESLVHGGYLERVDASILADDADSNGHGDEEEDEQAQE